MDRKEAHCLGNKEGARWHGEVSPFPAKIVKGQPPFRCLNTNEALGTELKPQRKAEKLLLPSKLASEMVTKLQIHEKEKHRHKIMNQDSHLLPTPHPATTQTGRKHPPVVQMKKLKFKGLELLVRVTGSESGRFRLAIP